MDKSRSSAGGYILAGLFGAAAGGIAVAIITKAIPTIMSRVMSNMMANMTVRMEGEGCNPEEM